MTTSLDLPGAAGAYASTPNSAELNITTDIDLRVDVALDDWTPVATTSLISKYVTTGNQRSWRLYVTPTGLLTIVTTPDGVTQVAQASTVAVGAADGSRRAVRVTLDVDNGASQRVARFYTAPTMAGPWTQLGTTVTTAGVTSIFNGTAPIEIGSHTNGTGDIAAGVFYSAQVRDGIDGTLLTYPIFGAFEAGSTTFTDQFNRPWTVHGTGTVVDDGVVPVGSLEELHALGRARYGLDLNGAVRRATGINKDVNGIAHQLWGKEGHAARTQLHAIVNGGEVADDESAPPHAAMTLVYEDDFDTDTGVWVPEPWYPSDVSGDTYSIADSVMTIRAFQADSYSYGEIGSLGARAAEAPFYPNAVTFNGGYFEARMRFTADPTTKASFWMLTHAHPNVYPGSHCPTLRAEWDIMEHLLSDDPHEVTSSLHRNNVAVCSQPAELKTVLHEDREQTMSDWHIWSGLWTPTEVRSYLDGQLFGSIPTYDSTDQEMYLLFLVTGNGTLPVYELEVDWVRVWQ